MARATFAAGCFWGVEDDFRKLDGVTATTVGYTGGTSVAPSYQEVCTGGTGHAEAVEIEYDPAVIGFATLADRFFELHDPTQRNRQGPDIGTQYRSAIFVHSPDQEEAARAALTRAQARHRRPIATQIVPAGPFYRAEDYHQQYYDRHHRVCGIA